MPRNLRIHRPRRPQKMHRRKNHGNPRRSPPRAKRPRRQPQKNPPEKKLLDAGHNPRGQKDPHKRRDLDPLAQPVNLACNEHRPERRGRQKRNPTPRRNIGPGARIFIQSELAQVAQAQPKEKRHDRHKRRHLQNPAEIPVEWKLRQPCEQPMLRKGLHPPINWRRNHTGRQQHRG